MKKLNTPTTRVSTRRGQRALVRLHGSISASAIFTIEFLESRRLLSTTIYVDANSPDPAGNGSSWDHAFRDLQLGLAVAPAGSSDEIHVANGTYHPTSGTDRTISFVLKSGVSLSGGYAGYGAIDPNARDVAANPTILSGEIGSADNTDNSFHVVIGSGTDNSTLLDGFTITAGAAGSTGGGGMYNANASLTISHCIFMGNFSISEPDGGNGGGIYDINSSPTLSDCLFSSNTAYYGAGMHDDNSASVLTNCTFDTNYGNGDAGGIKSLSGSLQLNGCTFSNNDGVGIATENSQTLSLSNCTFLHNSGGGMSALGNVGLASFINCTFTDNTETGLNGALYVNAGGPVSVNGCDFNGNSGNISGMHIITDGSCTLDNSTFADNIGGISGSIDATGSVTVSNCAFTSNGASGLGVSAGALAAVSGCTFANNSGNGLGVRAVGLGTVSNCTFSDNSDEGLSVISETSAAVHDCSLNNNGYGGWVSSIGSATVTTCTFANNSKTGLIITGSDTAVIGCTFIENLGGGMLDENYYDPGMAAVTNCSFTGNLIYGLDANVEGSITLDNCTFTETHRNGDTIAWGALIDAVGTATFSGCEFSDNSLGGLSLEAGAASISGSTFTGNSGAYAGHFVIWGGVMNVANCTFSENLAGGATIFTDGGGSAVISNSSFTNNSGPGGAGLSLLSAITMNNCTISNNNADKDGGGIYNYGGAVTLNNCALDGNAAQRGGAMFNNFNSGFPTANSSANNSAFTNNAATDGGAIYNLLSPNPSGLVLTDCALTGNSAANNGGGVLNDHSPMTLISCAVTNNTAGEYGGGIFNDHSSPVIDSSGFADNSATTGGGGIYNDHSSPTISESTFTSNSATAGSGGGIFNDYSSPLLTDCKITGNVASFGGGGIYNSSPSTPQLISCVFDSNTAVYGGGMYSTLAYPTLTACEFTTNSANFGAGIYSSSSSLTLTNCVFNGNTAANGVGGGAMNASSVATFINCTLVGNSAALGGGIYNTYASPTLINCTLASNIAIFGGGGIYSDFSSPAIKNSILWGNISTSGGQQIGFNVLAPVVAYSDIQNGWAGTGNIISPPQFAGMPAPGGDGVWGTADDDYGDLRLLATSPCIDVGSNAAVPVGISTDLAGNPRITDYPLVHDPGAIVDMGAYEAQALLATSAAFILNNAPPALTFTFNLPVSTASLASSDVAINELLPGGTLGGSLSASDFHYNPATKTVTFTLPALALDGNYRANLPAGSMNDVDGNQLAVGCILDFFSLRGDANHDRYVNTLDFTALAANFGQSGKTFADGDFNYDSVVNSLDFNALASKFGNYLAPAAGQLPQAGTTTTLAPASPGASLFSTQSVVAANSATLVELI